METTVKFSDIIRYILLGGIVCGMSFCWYVILTSGSDSVIAELAGLGSELKDANLVVGIGLISVFFVVGIVLQGIRILAVRSVHRYQRNHFLRLLWRCVVVYSAYNYCRIIKHSRKSSKNDYPDWIYTSERPEALIRSLSSYVENATSHDMDGDMKYLNDMSIALLLWVSLMCVLTFAAITVKAVCGDAVTADFSMLFCMLAVLCILAVLLAGISKAFAINYILSVGDRCNALEKNGSNLSDLYCSFGSPTAYILIRTHPNDLKWLRRALDSVAMQTYYDVRIIILEDIGSSSGSGEAKKIIDKFIEDQGKAGDKRNYLDNISYCQKQCNGAAGAAYYIREIFVNIAGRQDIAIFLDSDDKFRRRDAVHDIVAQMQRTASQVCITSFETVEEIGQNICNNGGRTHNELVDGLETDPADDFCDGKLCYLSSIGWTKSYSYDQLKQYYRLIGKYGEEYIKLAFYEDFPDIAALLFKGTTITGVKRPTHAYYKRSGSITCTPSVEAFRVQRTGFLALLVKMVLDNRDLFVEKAVDYLAHFVVFKSCQIENILAMYRNDDIGEFRQRTCVGFFRKALVEALDKNGMLAAFMDILKTVYGIGATDPAEVFALAAEAQVEGSDGRLDQSALRIEKERMQSTV